MMTFRRLYIKYLVWRNKAVDIWSKSAYPADVLSNLCSNGFVFEGVECKSMEGFLQALKYKELEKQRQICSMEGKEAKNKTTAKWQIDQVVWWKEQKVDRQSKEFLCLVKRAYQAMFEQNEHFRTALMTTCGKRLFHCRGVDDPYKTILTETEFCSILTEIRDACDQRKK